MVQDEEFREGNQCVRTHGGLVSVFPTVGTHEGKPSIVAFMVT